MAMKFLVGLLLALALPLSAAPDSTSVTLWVQWVCGTQAVDSVQPASWKPIGAELNKRFAKVFRWPTYYEVSRQEIAVEPGRMTRVHLGLDRDVAINFRSPSDLEVRLYHGGKLVRKAQRNLTQKMTIMGGDSSDREAWFLVVRRDKPKAE